MQRQHEFSCRSLWSGFLQELAANIGPGAVVTCHSQVVAWRDSEHLNHLGLLKWTWPNANFPKAPCVTRISLNKHTFDIPETASRRIGLAYRRTPSSTPGLYLEWSVLGEELLDFASWLPLWIRGQRDSSITIPLPPHPSHVWGKGLRATDYAWTVAAFDAHARFHDQEPWLHPLAIPACELTPAPARLAPASRGRVT
jgi:hypothetical protein